MMTYSQCRSTLSQSHTDLGDTPRRVAPGMCYLKKPQAFNNNDKGIVGFCGVSPYCTPWLVLGWYLILDNGTGKVYAAEQWEALQDQAQEPAQASSCDFL